MLVVGCNLLEVLDGSLVNNAHRVVQEVGADQCGDGKDLGIIVCRVKVVMMWATKMVMLWFFTLTCAHIACREALSVQEQDTKVT